MKDVGRLSDLVSVGPAMLRDFELLGVRTIEQLARRNPEKLYEQLCERTGKAVDICCLDVFRAAVAQARSRTLGTRLPAAQRNWWYWSRWRKAAEKKASSGY